MSTQTITFVKALRGGAIAGLIGAGLNNIWSIIAQQFGSVPPPGFTVNVTFASIVPVLLGSAIFYVLVKFLSKGQLAFVVVSSIFTLLSLYGPMQPTLPDGSAAPAGFALLTIPMHIISGGLAIWGIPRWSK